MKKVICFLCFLIIIFSLTACSQNDSKVSDGANNENPTSTLSANMELSDDKLAEIVAKSLGVLDKDSIEYSVTEMFYWDSAERYFKNVEFTQNGEIVAGASVDPYTGELLRNIKEYNSAN